MFQVRRKHPFIQVHPILLHLQYRLVQKWKPEDVPCGQKHDVNIPLDSSVLELDSGLREAFDVGFDDDVAADDSVGEVIIHCGVLGEWREVRLQTVGGVIEPLVQLCLRNLRDHRCRNNISFQPAQYIKKCTIQNL